MEKTDDVTDVWVFRRLGERDRCLPNQVRTKARNPVSLMLWGCFAGCFKGPLVPLHGAQTAQTYVQVLQEHLVPFILETLPENGVFDAIFQQDNESTHTAHFTERYLTQQEFLTMKLSSCSPDMNSIEHLWAALKKELYRRFSDTSDLPGDPEAVQCALAERLTIV